LWRRHQAPTKTSTCADAPAIFRRKIVGRNLVQPLLNATSMKPLVLTIVIITSPALAFAQVPDNYKTPGDASRVKTEQICSADFAASIKPVPGWARSEALERYGIRPESFSGEIDRLIPASLGGANSPDNLFPFRAGGGFTLDMKDALATKVRDMVCSGKMSLKDAQNAFKKDWTKSYQRLALPLNAAGQ
jgi:hypothetical protein